MKNEMDGLTGPHGLFRCPGSRGEWQVRRNKDGEIELYRTGREEIINGTRMCHGIERKVTKAKTEAELDAYFTPRPSTKTRVDPDQTNILKQAEELSQPDEQQP